eukprot:scaffold71729_cov61-Phaeocystis_antarctica.AAC.1
MPVAEGLAPPLQRLAEERLSGGEVTLVLQQQTEVVDGGERARMPIAERLASHLQRLAAQRLSGSEVVLGVQQRAEVADGGQRVRMPIAERLAQRLQCLAVQRLSSGEVALGLQQRGEVVGGGERARMPIAERLASRLQRLAGQRLSGGEVALGLQQQAEVADGVKRVRMPQQTEVVDGGERARMPIAECLARHFQRLAEQRLGLVVLALTLQLQSEPIQDADWALSIRALGLEPCTQQLEAQRVAILVHALAAAVGCVLPWARAPPFLEAVSVDPLGGAAAGARLHERPVL